MLGQGRRGRGQGPVVARGEDAPDNLPGNAETCDGADNDCDGLVDGFDLPVNLLCPAEAPNTVSSCQGVDGCSVTCAPHYFDLLEASPGCECKEDDMEIRYPADTCPGIYGDDVSLFDLVFGNIVPEGDEDWIVLYGGPRTSAWAFRVEVRLPSGATGGFEVCLARSCSDTPVCGSTVTIPVAAYETPHYEAVVRRQQSPATCATYRLSVYAN